MDKPFRFRHARLDDLPRLHDLIEASVCGLFALDHDVRQTRAALEHLFRIDPYPIEDGTYDVCEHDGRIVAAGGWSRRRNPYGNPLVEAAHAPRGGRPGARPAVVRGMFVHPAFARRGIARELLRRVETAARAEGFATLELLSTPSGEALYRRAGFHRDGIERIALPGGVALVALRMSKPLAHETVRAAA